MKTLKRTLCLVLALVMVVGMLAVGASAKELTDAADVQYEVPVNVMVGMGIIDGYDDDSFQPKKVVNRAEAAKMICYALIGKQAADGLVCAAKPFEDVEVNAWYAPYVSYLARLNVIAGSDGKFDAAAPVTGLALAKMLLVAAGYGQEDEYENAGYAENTYIDAMTQGIFTGTKATDLLAGATREEAALYIYNAMTKIDMVTYSPGSALLGLGSSYSAGTTPKTMAEKQYGYCVDTAASYLKEDEVITSVALNTTLPAATNKFYGKLVATTTNNYKFVVDSYDKVGHVVDVYFKDETTVYYADYQTYTVDTTAYTAAKWTALAKTVDLALSAGVPTKTANLYTNYAADSTDTVAANQILIVKTDANGLDDVVAIQENLIEQVKIQIDYKSVSKTVEAKFYFGVLGGTYQNTKFYDSADANFDGKPDTNTDATGINWASYVTKEKPQAFAYYTVQKIDNKYYFTEIKSVTGAVTLVKDTNTVDTLTIGGQTIQYIGQTDLMGKNVTITSAMVNSGNTYKAYLNHLGQVFYVELVDGTDVSAIGDLAYAAAYKEFDTTADAVFVGADTYDFYVQLAFADGKYGTYKLAKIDGKTVADAATYSKLAVKTAHIDFETTYEKSGDIATYGLDATVLTTAGLLGVVYAKINEAGEAELYTTTAAAAVSQAYAVTSRNKWITDEMMAVTNHYIADGGVYYYMDANSAFVYMGGIGDSTFKATLKTGAHAAGNLEYLTTFVYTTDLTTGICTIKAAFLKGAFVAPSSSTAKELYFVAAYNGYVAEGHSYTVYQIGSAEPQTIYTQNTSAVTVGGADLAKIQTSTVGSKTVKNLVDSTVDLTSLTLDKVAFTVNGVTYLQDSTDYALASSVVYVNNVLNGVAAELSDLIIGDTVLVYVDGVATSATYNKVLSVFVKSEAPRA